MIPIDKLFVGFGGVAAILFVAWFFFGKKTQEVTVAKQVHISVDGGYSPLDSRETRTPNHAPILAP